MLALERNLGVWLLNRTTRSVSPTEAGERLLARLTPALRDLNHALDAVAIDRGRLSGTLKINANEVAAGMLLRAVVPRFLANPLRWRWTWWLTGVWSTSSSKVLVPARG